MSLTVLLSLVTWLLVRRRRWVLAGLTGCLCAMAYPMAVLLAPAILVYILLPSRLRSWSWLGQAAAVCGLTAAGTGAAFLLILMGTGHFDSYLAMHAHAGTGPVHNPIVSYLGILRGNTMWSSPIGASRPLNQVQIFDIFAVGVAASSPSAWPPRNARRIPAR
jgi:hypothetical protein